MSSARIQVDFFNSYIIRKVRCQNVEQTTPNVFMSPGITPRQDISTTNSTRNYYIEEARIRGGFENNATDQGVRAYFDEPYPLQQRRINSLIYSGVFNSRTGINRTNNFPTGAEISKSLDPIYGSIQKIYAEDTNLLIFQENKIHRALIDKDTIYTTESGTQTQAANKVIGQFVPYKGEYGISKNPESFAIYNYRKYFADKNRNAIMRLSNDGLTEISMYGMMDFFRDELINVSDSYTENETVRNITKISQAGLTTEIYVDVSASQPIEVFVGMTLKINNIQQPGYVKFIGIISATEIRVLMSELIITTTAVNDSAKFCYQTKGSIVGGWDIHSKNYLVSLQKNPINTNGIQNDSFKTLTFDEKINGWVSFFTFKPTKIFSVVNKFYSINQSDLYQQYNDTTANERGKFYGNSEPATITFVFNENSSIVKNFQTLSYEGSNGWQCTFFNSDFTGYDSNPANPPVAGYIQNQDITNVTPQSYLGEPPSVYSYDQGSYVDPTTGQTLRSGFDRKENRYVANLVSRSAAREGEIIFNNQISGIKGYFATVKFSTDTLEGGTATQLGGPKELWSASTKYVVSSY